MGSGTTIVADNVFGRRAIVIEKDPEYFMLERERIRNG
jgi:DNA modification methylase